MRELFKSESRALRNLLVSGWRHELLQPPLVLHELIFPPQDPRSPCFNADFVLEFVKRPLPEGATACVAAPILPDSIGAGLSVLVEKETLNPLVMELMFGDSVGISFFEDVLQHLYAGMIRITAGGPEAGVPEHVMRKTQACLSPEAVAESSFSRVMVVEGEVCFLISPESRNPVPRGQRYSFTRAGEFDVDCYLEDGVTTCLDGWLRTTIQTSEQKLVAFWEDQAFESSGSESLS